MPMHRSIALDHRKLCGPVHIHIIYTVDFAWCMYSIDYSGIAVCICMYADPWARLNVLGVCYNLIVCM